MKIFFSFMGTFFEAASHFQASLIQELIDLSGRFNQN